METYGRRLYHQTLYHQFAFCMCNYEGEDEPPTDNSNVITLKIKPKVTSSSSLSNGDKLEDGEQQDDDEDEVDYTEEDMMAMMGFNGFNTTKVLFCDVFMF